MVTRIDDTVSELRRFISDFSARLLALDPQEFSAKPNAGKWSKKEVLGHLVDSAHNNYRRFICGQYEQSPPKILYQQDFWVSANGYQEMESESLIQLWCLMNERICVVLERMPEKDRQLLCDTGGGAESSLHTLEWLASDYVKHMKHHMNQIFRNSFDIVYP